MLRIIEVFRSLKARKSRETPGDDSSLGRSPEIHRFTLPCGSVVSVDAADFVHLKKLSWSASRHKKTPGRVYVKHCFKVAGRRWTVPLHRMIAAPKLGEMVDHINGNPLDNRRENLRICAARQNAWNVTSSKHQKRGGYKGVTWHKRGKKWEAGCNAGPVRPDGKRKRVYLGLFADPVEAARAYDRLALEAFGEFASLNFPEDGPAHAIDIAARVLGSGDACAHILTHELATAAEGVGHG